MAKFTKEQKKFIVQSFARNTSATHVRREFLLANEIQGRKRDQYHLKDFSRVNDHFEKNGSILKTPVKRTKTKRTNENLQKIQDTLEKKGAVLNKKGGTEAYTQQFYCSEATSLWLKSEVLSAVHSATFDWSSHGAKKEVLFMLASWTTSWFHQERRLDGRNHLCSQPKAKSKERRCVVHGKPSWLRSDQWS